MVLGRKYRSLVIYAVATITVLLIFFSVYHTSRSDNISISADSKELLDDDKSNTLLFDQFKGGEETSADSKDMSGSATESSTELVATEPDQYDKEVEIDNFIDENKDDPSISKKLSAMTDEEIREELTNIKEKQAERNKLQSADSNEEANRFTQDDKIFGTLIDNPDRIRNDSSPDDFPWAQYEIDRRVPKTYKFNQGNQNATLFTLCRNSEIYEILDSIQQLQTRFNGNYNYDWVFLNDEPFSEEFIELTSNMVTGRSRYGLIPKNHWSYPDFIDQEKAREIRESRKWSSITYGSSESYRHMCRFNSLFFYKHPIMMEYQYYWRVEPHVSFGCDIIEDPFKFLNDNNKKYGFTISMRELPNTIETLWETSKIYFKKIHASLPENNLLNFISDDNGDSYNLCHYWTNFEIANLDIYRNEIYEGYVQHLDQAGGFFYERWGDAPVHSIIFSLMLKNSEVYLFQDISYEHTVAASCPLNDSFRKLGRCTCDPFKDWSVTSESSCNIKFLDVSNQAKNVDHDKYYNSIQEKLIENEILRNNQRKLRMETARRQSEARRRKSEERRKARLEAQQLRKQRKKKSSQNEQQST